MQDYSNSKRLKLFDPLTLEYKLTENFFQQLSMTKREKEARQEKIEIFPLLLLSFQFQKVVKSRKIRKLQM